MDLVVMGKRMVLTMLMISMIFITKGCNKQGEDTSVEEVNLSEEIQTIEAFGLVRAEEIRNIMIDFPGVIQDILVKEGQKVNLGDPMILLDMTDYTTEISNTEKEIHIARLEQQRIQKSIQGLHRENRELEIEKLTNDLKFAQEVYQQSVDELNSYRKLYELGAISQQKYEEIQRNVEEKKKNIDDISYQLKEVNYKKEQEIQQLLLRQGAEGDQLRIQNERLTQLENKLDLMKEKLNKPYIKENYIVCEFDKAVVYDIKYTIGDIIDPTIKVLSIAGLKDLTIEADIVEDFIMDVKIGAKVKIVPVADRSRHYHGKVIYISNMAFKKNGETVVPVRISIDNLDDFLMPNYNVDVFIEVDRL